MVADRRERRASSFEFQDGFTDQRLQVRSTPKYTSSASPNARR